MSEPVDKGPADQTLVERVLVDGDEGAFRTLYRRHTGPVYRFVLPKVGHDSREAEELVQEAWYRAASALDGFEWRSRFRTWLFSIAHNCVRERFRKNGRHTTEDPQDHEIVRMPEPLQGIDLERAIESLADGYRTVLLLHDVEGFTHVEIAEILGIAEGTSRSQLVRARRAVRRMLRPKEESNAH